MSYGIKTGATDQIALFRAYDNDGNGDPTIPKTDLTSASAGLSLSVFRVGASAVSIASLSYKAADDTAHADGAIRAISGNLYSIDVPDAAVATQVAGICIEGSLTDGAIEGEFHPLVGYDVTATAVGASVAGDQMTLEDDSITSDKIQSDAIDAGHLAASAVTEIASGILDRVLSGNHDTSGTPGAFLQQLDGSISGIGTAFLATSLSKGTAGTIERAFWQILKTQAVTDGEIAGTPAVGAFDTNLTAADGVYDHQLLLFTSGSLAGEARPIATYVNASGRITLQEDLTAAPSASDEFIIVPQHIHPVSEIQDGLATASALSTVSTNVSTLLTRIPAALFNGITSMAAWLGSLAGKTADTSTRTEINATTAGAGYNETTDSQEAIRDRGDAAWTPSGSSTLGQEDIDAIVQGVTAVGEQVTSASTSITQLTAGDDWDQEYSITVLGSPDEVVYMLKHEMDDADNDAVLWVSSSTGLVRLNGADATASASEASLTVNASDVTLVVDSSISVQIPTGNFVEGIKKLVEGGDFHYRTNGPVRVVRGTIREAS